MADDEDLICIVCCENPVNCRPSNCFHLFCRKCLQLNSLREKTCPLCRATFDDVIIYRVQLLATKITKYGLQHATQPNSYDPGSPILVPLIPEEIPKIDACTICKSDDDEHCLLICDGPSCGRFFHSYCCSLPGVPKYDWFCSDCEKIYGSPCSMQEYISLEKAREMALAGYELDDDEYEQREEEEQTQSPPSTSGTMESQSSIDSQSSLSLGRNRNRNERNRFYDSDDDEDVEEGSDSGVDVDSDGSGIISQTRQRRRHREQQRSRASSGPSRRRRLLDESNSESEDEKENNEDDRNNNIQRASRNRMVDRAVHQAVDAVLNGTRQRSHRGTSRSNRNTNAASRRNIDESAVHSPLPSSTISSFAAGAGMTTSSSSWLTIPPSVPSADIAATNTKGRKRAKINHNNDAGYELDDFIVSDSDNDTGTEDDDRERQDEDTYEFRMGKRETRTQTQNRAQDQRNQKRSRKTILEAKRPPSSSTGLLTSSSQAPTYPISHNRPLYSSRSNRSNLSQIPSRMPSTSTATLESSSTTTLSNDRALNSSWINSHHSATPQASLPSSALHSTFRPASRPIPPTPTPAPAPASSFSPAFPVMSSLSLAAGAAAAGIPLSARNLASNGSEIGSITNVNLPSAITPASTTYTSFNPARKESLYHRKQAHQHPTSFQSQSQSQSQTPGRSPSQTQTQTQTQTSLSRSMSSSAQAFPAAASESFLNSRRNLYSKQTTGNDTSRVGLGIATGTTTTSSLAPSSSSSSSSSSPQSRSPYFSNPINLLDPPSKDTIESTAAIRNRMLAAVNPEKTQMAMQKLREQQQQKELERRREEQQQQQMQQQQQRIDRQTTLNSSTHTTSSSMPSTLPRASHSVFLRPTERANYSSKEGAGVKATSSISTVTSTTPPSSLPAPKPQPLPLKSQCVPFVAKTTPSSSTLVSSIPSSVSAEAGRPSIPSRVTGRGLYSNPNRAIVSGGVKENSINIKNVISAGGTNHVTGTTSAVEMKSPSTGILIDRPTTIPPVSSFSSAPSASSTPSSLGFGLLYKSQRQHSDIFQSGASIVPRGPTTLGSGPPSGTAPYLINRRIIQSRNPAATGGVNRPTNSSAPNEKTALGGNFLKK